MSKQILSYIILFFIVNVIFSSCDKQCQPEIFLIPDGYKGPIYIIYNIKNGSKKEYENNKRIYRLPANGILLTQFKDEYGIIDQEYYYQLASGKRIKLGILDSRDFNEPWSLKKNPKEPSRDSLAIFNPASVGFIGEGKNKYYFQSTFVGTYNNLKNSSWQEVNYAYIDSLENKLK
jgi:hypothetical protein